MARAGLTVGALAKRTGLTVRALRHYDEIGLLAPSRRSEAGYRLYAALDVARLQQIRSLRQLGFSLDEIKDCLDRPDFAPLRVIDGHIARLREQIELQRDLCERLEAIARGLQTSEQVSGDELMKTLEVMSMVEQGFTPEQLAYLKERERTLGQEHIREVEAEWPRLIEQVRMAMDNGVDPADEQVQQLARRWMELVKEFTGGDPGIENTLRSNFQRDATMGRPDMDPRMMEYFGYISRALAAPKQGE